MKKLDIPSANHIQGSSLFSQSYSELFPFQPIIFRILSFLANNIQYSFLFSQSHSEFFPSHPIAFSIFSFSANHIQGFFLMSQSHSGFFPFHPITFRIVSFYRIKFRDFTKYFLGSFSRSYYTDSMAP